MTVRRIESKSTGNPAHLQPVIAIQSAPPGAPSTGDRYLVDTGGSGAWVGFDDSIAQYNADTTWLRTLPQEGFIVRDAANDNPYIYISGAWEEYHVAGGGSDFAPDSTITVQRGADDIISATNLRTAYTAAKALLPGGNALSATNRAVVLIPAGRYDFVLGDVADLNHGLELDTQFVDLIGMTGQREDVVLTSAIATASRGTVEQTADDVKLRGFTMEITSTTGAGTLDTLESAYFPNTALANTELTNIECITTSALTRSMRIKIEYAGTYEDCKGSVYSFGYTSSGTFVNCEGGDNSFGRDGTANGTFIDCTGGFYCFGSNGIASGTFTRCVGGGYDFGWVGTASGIFTDCTSGFRSWKGANPSGSAAIMRRCISTGRTDPIANWEGLMIDCEIEVTSTNDHAVEVTADTAEIINCKLTANGTGYAVYAAAPQSIKISNLETDFPIHANITNTATTHFGTIVSAPAGYTSDATILVERGTTDVLSAASLRTAYTAAKALTPGGNALAIDNRAAVIIPAGRYDFVLGDVGDLNHGLELDTEFIDLIGMTGIKEDVVLTSAIATASRGTVEQTADDVKMRSFTMEITSASSTGSNATEASAYFPTSALANVELTNIQCKSTNTGVYSMRTHIEYAGIYTNCTGGYRSFACFGTASGTFTDCVGGDFSFGTQSGGLASGTFTNCTGGEGCFGRFVTASGTFINCCGSDDSFGSFGTASGTFINCTCGSSNGFGNSGTASGIFIDCTGGPQSWYTTSGSGSAAIMRRCRSIGRTQAIPNWQGLMIDCEIEVTSTNKNAVEVTADTARIYKSILIATGTGAGVYSNNIDCRIANVMTNLDIDLGTGSNLIGDATGGTDPNVIVDPQITL